MGLLLFFFFAFSAPPFSVGEILHVHVAYKKYELKKRILTFFYVNIKYISSREIKTSEFSLVLRTRKNSYVFNTLDEINFEFTSKKNKYPLFNIIVVYHIRILYNFFF